MGYPEILCVSKLPPFLMSDLQDHFQIHDHEHITDPGALGRIRAIVGGGESKIDKKLLSLFPAVEMVSIFGVGYDGVDIPTIQERGIRVTHTPGVLNDDVADLALGLMLSVARRVSMVPLAMWGVRTTFSKARNSGTTLGSSM